MGQDANEWKAFITRANQLFRPTTHLRGAEARIRVVTRRSIDF